MKHRTKYTVIGEVVFLLLAFVMGLVYFTIVMIGLSLAAGTLVIWIGLPVLFATLYTVKGLAIVERKLVSTLLGMPHPEQPRRHEPVRGFLGNLGAMLRDPSLWMGMLYMLFIKFPLCIIGFCLTLTFICLSAALTFLPLIYLINLFVDGILISSGIPSAQSILIPTLLEIHGRFEPIMFFRSFAGVPLGLVCSFLTLQMIHGLARLSGLLANVMLGPGSQSYPMQPHIPTYAQPMLYQEQHMYVD